MLVCLACSRRFTNGWTCPECSYAPVLRDDGVLVFAETTDDGYAPGYHDELVAVEASNFWFRGRNKLITWALRTFAPDARSFFEVGCGNGFVLRGIRDENQIDVAGGELFDEGLAVARARLPGVPMYKVDARRLPFDAEFDAIGAFDLLEHIAEDELVLRQLHQALRPGGTLLITVPQHPRLWSAADDYAHHRRRYRRTELEDKVTSAGFELVHVTSFLVLLVPLLLASRWRRTSLGEDYDALREFRLPRPVNNCLELVVSLELALTRRGIRWPVGGSLVLAARRPEVK